MNELCKLCPHRCNVNRTDKLGWCKASRKIEIGGSSIHMYEEPCISGENGSGTVFFSKCNMACVFCQNYEISNLGNGREITVEELSDIFLKHQSDNAENINLVSPTIYTDKIIDAVKLARDKGLTLPIVYNTNGYENVDTIKKLDGIVDCYLPDLKYADDAIGLKYSNVENYFEIATKAILEMEKQVGSPKFDDRGMIKSGLIVRHLVLPNNIQNTKLVLKWIKENLNPKTYVSVMTQYFPTYNAKNFEEINRKITKEEYDEVENYISELGIENGYMQDFSDENEECYVPKWDY